MGVVKNVWQFICQAGAAYHCGKAAHHNKKAALWNARTERLLPPKAREEVKRRIAVHAITKNLHKEVNAFDALGKYTLNIEFHTAGVTPTIANIGMALTIQGLTALYHSDMDPMAIDAVINTVLANAPGSTKWGHTKDA